MDRARQVYRAALELTPHKYFTFAKLWLMYAHFEIRQKDLTAARRAMVRRKKGEGDVGAGYHQKLVVCAVTGRVLVIVISASECISAGLSG